MKKTALRIRLGAATAGLISGAALAAAAPAVAAEVPFGAGQCAQGTIYTRATTTEIPTHYLYQGGRLDQRQFPNSRNIPTQYTWRSGLYSSTSGGIQTVGTIPGATQNCGD